PATRDRSETLLRDRANAGVHVLPSSRAPFVGSTIPSRQPLEAAVPGHVRTCSETHVPLPLTSLHSPLPLARASRQSQVIELLPHRIEVSCAVEPFMNLAAPLVVREPAG